MYLFTPASAADFADQLHNDQAFQFAVVERRSI
jgi:hypothetical protein